jgi:DNA-binding response OmpR family regulator
MSALSDKQRVHGLQALYDILLIEDDEATCEMLIECIQSQSPYRVQYFTSGEAVLQSLQEIKEADPNLFIIDLLLPDMTGLQLFDHLHSIEAFKRVPTLMITATTLNEETHDALSDRSVSLLTKPFELTDLLNYLEYIHSGLNQQLL